MPFSLPGIDNSQFSGAGYPDPLAPARSANSSIFNKATDPNQDWMETALRQAEDERKRREEAERQAQLQQQFIQQAQQQQQEAARQAAIHEQAQQDKFIKDNADRFGTQVGDAYGVMRDAVSTAKAWAQTPDGMRFLTGGGQAKFDYADFNSDPLKYIASNPNFREFYGRSAGDNPNSALVSNGFPDMVAQGMDVYFHSKDGEKEYKGTAGARIANPVYEGLRGLGAPEPVAGMGAGLAGVVPVVGPAIAGASGENTDVTDPKFWGEAGMASVAPALPALGGPAASVAEGLVPESGLLLPTAARFAGRSLAGAGVNAGFEGLNQVASGQFNPRALDTAAATGAAMENIGPALRSSVPVLAKVPPELLVSGATYGGARLAGQDNSDALQDAALAGIATSVARRGPVESLKTGFGLDRLLPRDSQGRPVVGAQVDRVPPTSRIEHTDAAGNVIGHLEVSGDTILAASVPDGPRGETVAEVLAEKAHDAGITKAVPGIDRTALRALEEYPDFATVEPMSPGGNGRVPPEEPPPSPPPVGEPPIPRGPAEPSAPSDIDEIITYAKQQVNTPQFAERVLKSIPGVGRALVALSNPAALFDTPVKRLVLAGAVARENARRLFENDWARTQALTADDILSGLTRDKGPHIGPISAQTLGRAALEVAPPALAYGAGEALGLSNDQKAKLVLGGLAATGGLSYAFRKGGFRSSVFDDIKYIGDEPLPKQLQSGWGKLVDIIERSDEGVYDWSALPAGARDALDKLQNLRMDWLDTVNKDRLAAGLEPVTMRAANKLYHLWDAGTAAELKGDVSYTGGMTKANVGDLIGSGKKREQPDTVFEALQQNPKLKLARQGNPAELIRAQLNELSRMRADAAFFKTIKDDPNAARKLNVQEIRDLKKSGLLDKQGMSDAKGALRSENDVKNDLYSQSWRTIPGFGDDWYFSPDVQEAVQKLFIDSQGKENPIIRALDVATTEIRQAAFVSDFSAWSLQGMMQVLQSPGTALRNFYPLFGATFLGRKFTDHWLTQHTDLLRDYLKAGGVLARETEGTEHTVRTLGDAPGIRNLEQAGFSNYLPIHRLLTFQNERNINSFVQSLPGPIRNAYGSHVALAGLNAAKYGAFGTAAYYLASQDDQSNWAKLAEIALAGGVLALGVKPVEGKLGKTLYDRLNPENQREVNIRSAKTSNRVSGVYNKAQLGITNRQGTLERTLLVRSPALFRNMATILKLAAFNPGPEGAQALFYLARTFVLTAGLLGAAKLAAGQQETFDPTDPDSLLNPKNILRADFGAAGKLSFSNPYISLLRGAMNTQRVEGAPGGGQWTFKSAADGLRSFLIGRAPDVLGPTLYQQFAPEGSPGGNKSALTQLGNNLMNGDVQKALSGTAGRFIPVALRDVAKTGALSATGLPGTEADKNYNTTGEKVLGAVAPVTGLNYSAETQSQEAGRRESDAVQKQFPGVTDFNKNAVIDRGDLNATQRQQFDASPEGQSIGGLKDQVRTDQQAANPDQPKSQIDLYFDQKAQETDRHVQALKSLDDAVANGSLSKLKWRQAYADEQTLHRHNQAQIESDAKGQMVTDDSGQPRLIFDPATGKATTMDVLTYLRKSDHPEDQALDGYYAIFDDKAVHNADNTMNWDKLDAAQAKYMAGLDPATRDYVQGRLDEYATKGITDSKGNVVTLPTLGQYQNLKDSAQPFWDIRDQQFASLQSKDKFFAQFQSYSDFQSQAQAAADAQGVQLADVLSYLEHTHKAYHLFTRDVTVAQQKFRAKNPDIDYGLQDFYGRPAVNWKGYIARTVGNGDRSYDTLPNRPLYATPPAAIQLRFAQQYAKQHGIDTFAPLRSQISGYGAQFATAFS